MLQQAIKTNNIILSAFDAEAMAATFMVKEVDKYKLDAKPTKPYLFLCLLSIDNFTSLNEVMHWLKSSKNICAHKGIKMILGVVIHSRVYENGIERMAMLKKLNKIADGVVLIDTCNESSRACALARFAQFVLNMNMRGGFIFFEEVDILDIAQGISFFTFNNDFKFRYFLKSYHIDLLLKNHLSPYDGGYCLFFSFRYDEQFDVLPLYEDIDLWADDFSLQLYLEQRPRIALFDEENLGNQHLTDLLFVNLQFDDKE
ncbi:MAG TPA: hypothetical protein PLJ88_05220 [Agitococcus sp.]|nr:hypothetical protein [Agitococcus sp.]